ncbi:MAG TPA: hypothetical protein VHI93_06365, partial [Candidatus Thermoplasmatota archaeon]|nr:hypothetical protein [Candidatus Thermoplasmatota archaeon]
TGAAGFVGSHVAEALVRAGQPFRAAYATVAQAFAKVESGLTLQAALEAENLPPALLEAALAALQPDPARRATLGGPAPAAVQASLALLAAESRDLASRVAAAQQTAEMPLDLLTRPVDALLEP